MDLFQKLRKRKGEKRLLSDIANGSKKIPYVGFDNIRSIAIIWSATDESALSAFLKFKNSMSEKNIVVDIITFVNDSSISATLAETDNLITFCKTDILYCYIPKEEISHRILSKEYDLLIDANFDDCLPLRYITNMMRCGIKVGRYEEKADAPFDMMIATNEQEIEKYLHETMKYLALINKE